jgi:hypothetical protein
LVKIFEFKIYDISGRMIKSGNVNGSDSINLHDLEKGNYIVKIITSKGETYDSKIIKK